MAWMALEVTPYIIRHTQIQKLNPSFYLASDQSKSPVVVVIHWKNNYPNSPFTQCPIFLLAAKEKEENIRQFMIDLINSDTDQMHRERFSHDNDLKVHVDIVRSMFDGKMAAILSGAGGGSFQLCTATHKEKKDRD